MDIAKFVSKNSQSIQSMESRVAKLPNQEHKTFSDQLRKINIFNFPLKINFRVLWGLEEERIMQRILFFSSIM